MQWIAALILHIWLSKDIKQGLDMMKFAVNHRYKFNKRHLAFFAGWLQFSVALSCEVIGYLELLQATSPSDVLSNFLGIYVIIEIDEIFFESLKCIALKRQMIEDVVEKLLKITQTTSNEAIHALEENKVGDNFFGEEFREDKQDQSTKQEVKDPYFPTTVRVNFE